MNNAILEDRLVVVVEEEGEEPMRVVLDEEEADVSFTHDFDNGRGLRQRIPIIYEAPGATVTAHSASWTVYTSSLLELGGLGRLGALWPV